MSAWRLLLLALAVVGGALEKPEGPRLLAIGDLHGDYDKAVKLLIHAKIMTADKRWCAGRDTVVQMGDVTDRGPFARDIYQLLRKLGKEAEKAGGEVITLMGNHELLNLQGMQAYVSPEELNAFGGREKRLSVVSPTGEFGKVLMECPVTVNRRGFVFVHAGFLKEFAVLGVDGVNAAVKEKILSGLWDDPILGNSGPMWTRFPVMAAMRGNCTQNDEAIKALNKTTPTVSIVVGHTIQPRGRVGIHCNGRMIAADVAISNYIIEKDSFGYVELWTENGRPVALPHYFGGFFSQF